MLLVIDGLGLEPAPERPHLTPTLAGLDGTAITTVAPSTTATALTSISTGLPPGEHGVMGYRIAVGAEVLNVLRWTTDGRDAAARSSPASCSRTLPFGGQRPPVLTRAEFAGSGFTLAHLEPVRFTGYRTLGTLTAELVRLTPRRRTARVRVLRGPRQGEPRVRARRAVRRGAPLDRPPRRHAARGPPVRHRPRHHRRPRPGRDRRQRDRAAERCAHPCGHAERRGPVPLAARPFRSRPRARRRRRRRSSASTPGCAPASRRSTRAGTARRSPMRRPAAWATCCSPPRAPSPSSTRRTPAPTCSSAATARSPPTRCSCRSWRRGRRVSLAG